MFVTGCLNKGKNIQSVFDKGAFESFKEEFPDKTMGITTFRNLVKNMKYTYKSIKHMPLMRNTVDSILDRYLWCYSEIIERNINYYNCVFVDEAAFAMSTKAKAWALSGTTPVSEDSVKLSDNSSVTCIAAISWHGLLCMAVKVKGNIDSKIAENTIDTENLLPLKIYFQNLIKELETENPDLVNLTEFFKNVPEDRESSGTQTIHFVKFLWNLLLKMYSLKNEFDHRYIYLDNAPIHEKNTIHAILTLFNKAYNTNFEILFGFKYSPELNPIELYWKNLRGQFNVLTAETNILSRLIKSADKMNPDHFPKYIMHSAKMFQKCLSLQPLSDDKIQVINTNTNDDYEISMENHVFVNDLKSLFSNKQEVASQMKKGNIKYIGKHPYGPGFRVYFSFKNKNYKCSLSKIKLHAPQILEAPQVNVKLFDKAKYVLVNHLKGNISILKITRKDSTVYFKMGKKLCRCSFELMAKEKTEALINYYVNLKIHRIILEDEMQETKIVNKKRKGDIKAVVSKRLKVDVQILEIKQVGHNRRVVIFMSQGMETKLSYTNFKLKYPLYLRQFESSVTPT